jgi:hypothetical protein
MLPEALVRRDERPAERAFATANSRNPHPTVDPSANPDPDSVGHFIHPPD